MNELNSIMNSNTNNHNYGGNNMMVTYHHTPSFSNSKWNKRIEKVIKKVEKQSKNYKDMHEEFAYTLYQKYNNYMLLSIITSPFAGVISVIGMFIFTEENAYIVTITSTLLSVVSGIFISMVKFGKFDELSNSHKIAAARYLSLENNIKRQLSLYKNDRISSEQYLNWMTTTFDELITISPILPKNIHDRYYEKIENG